MALAINSRRIFSAKSYRSDVPTCSSSRLVVTTTECKSARLGASLGYRLFEGRPRDSSRPELRLGTAHYSLVGVAGNENAVCDLVQPSSVCILVTCPSYPRFAVEVKLIGNTPVCSGCCCRSPIVSWIGPPFDQSSAFIRTSSNSCNEDAVRNRWPATRRFQIRCLDNQCGRAGPRSA